MEFTDAEKESYAIQAIIEYKNNPDLVNEAYVRSHYMLAVKMIIENLDSKFASNGLKSLQEGARKVEFQDSSELIDSNIRAFIGYPYIRVF